MLVKLCCTERKLSLLFHSVRAVGETWGEEEHKVIFLEVPNVRLAQKSSCYFSFRKGNLMFIPGRKWMPNESLEKIKLTEKLTVLL